MNRKNQILAGFLALQVVLVAVIFWPRPVAAPPGGGSLFPGLDASKITALTIRDADGRQVRLARGQDGWVLPQADDYPCLATRVQPLLDKLVSLKADRLVTQTRASHKQLKVGDEDYQRQIEYELADGTRHKLYLGVAAGYQATHVRAEGSDDVYLASGLSVADAPAQPSGWVDTLYLSVPQDQLVALMVENANGTLEFERDDAGVWTMRGLAANETADEESITAFASQVTSVNMIQPLGKTEQESYELKTPGAAVTAKARSQDGTVKSYAYRVGAQASQDNSYVVISSESPYYVRVAGFAVEDLLRKRHSDFLQLPEAPTPAQSQ